MVRALLLFLLLSACGGVSWNTTVADNRQVRSAMLASVVPGRTTEKRFVLQWGQPTQKMREGAQLSYIYRNMSNPEGYLLPQFGNSQAYVVVTFQYGLAIGAYSSDTEGCRATFAPRPPGPGFDNPTTVHTVNCGIIYDGSTEQRPIMDSIEWLADQVDQAASGLQGGAGSRTTTIRPSTVPMVPDDSYLNGQLK